MSEKTAQSWNLLLEKTARTRNTNEMRAFAKYCVDHDIAPHDLSDAVVSTYADALETDGGRRVRERVGRLCGQLQAAHALDPERLPVAVSRPARAARNTRHHPLTAFPESFQQDMDAFEAELTADKATTVTYVKQSPQTAERTLTRLREAASRLVDDGVSIDTFDSLTAFEKPDLIERLSDALDRDGAAGNLKRSYAKTLQKLAVIRGWEGSAAHAAVRRVITGTPAHHADRDLTAGSERTLLALASDKTDGVLSRFPREALEAAAAAQHTATALKMSCAGAAVALALAVPLAPRELVAVHRDNIRFTGDGAGWFTHPIEGDVYPLPAGVATVLADHLDRVARLAGSNWLLPGRQGDAMTSRSLTMLFHRDIKPAIGLDIHPDLLRLRHAVKILAANPDDLERTQVWMRFTDPVSLLRRLQHLLQMISPSQHDRLRT